MPTQPESRTPGGRPRDNRDPGVSDRLVREVADRVYAMLMRDLRIERERYPPSAKGLSGRGGW